MPKITFGRGQDGGWPHEIESVGFDLLDVLVVLFGPIAIVALFMVCVAYIVMR